MRRYVFDQIYSEFYKRRNTLLYQRFWDRIHLDPVLILGILVLSGVSLILLYSATTNEADLRFYQQAVRIAFGFLLMVLCAQISPEYYKKMTPQMFFTTLLLLVIVLVMGKIGKGAQRWIDFKIIKLQPSEIVKYITPMMIAWYLTRYPIPPSLKNKLFAFMLIFIPFVLVLKQPDLGTAIVIALSGGMVIFIVGLGLRTILLSTLGVAAISPIFWFYGLHTYQKKRILTFINPELDPFGSGYHIIQSKIAIGSGGIWGKGWLSGTQAHLNFLPEHATDFVFSLCAEEFGILGCAVILSLYLLITLRCLYFAQSVDHQFRRLVIASLALIVFFSAIINMAMVLGLLPVVGVPLPIVSYGGSSLLATFAAFGIVQSMYMHRSS